MMRCGEATAVVGGLSSPGKMPGKAFGISATKCITGSKLRNIPGSDCSNCYALKNLYVMPNVRKAHDRRFRALTEALNDATARDKWVRSMTVLIEREEHFRWHDSGDLQSVEHLRLIVDVVKATPRTQHWLPTKEYGFVRDYEAAGDPLPANLTVRISSGMRNRTRPAAAIPDGMTASAVWDNHSEAPGYRCPSRQQGNACKDCRACWSRDVALVTYENH
jgi:Gene product 88